MFIEGTAIRIAEGNDRFLQPIKKQAIDLVLLFVAHVKKAGSVPDWTFGEAESGGYDG